MAVKEMREAIGNGKGDRDQVAWEEMKDREQTTAERFSSTYVLNASRRHGSLRAAPQSRGCATLRSAQRLSASWFASRRRLLR